MICVLLFLTCKPGIFFFTASAVFYLTEKKWANAVILFMSGVMVFICWQWLEFSYGSTGYFGVMQGTLDEYQRIFYLDAITFMVRANVYSTIVSDHSCFAVFITAFFYFGKQLFSQFAQRQNVVLFSLAGVYSVYFYYILWCQRYKDAERFLNVVYPLWIMMAVSVGAQIVP